MSSLLPIRSDPTPGEQNPRVVDLEGEDADAVFGALSSDTARQVVAALHEEPRTQSEIADVLDTTVQNVRYHLDNLEEAGLVEVVDTWYSSRGNEMKVYAPADGALIVSGDESEASRLKTALSRIVGGVGVIGVASVLLQSLAERFATGGASAGAPGVGAGSGDGDGGAPGGDGGAPGGDGGGDGAAPVEDGAAEATTTAAEYAQDAPPDATEQATRTAVQEGYDATRTVTTTATDGGVDVVRSGAENVSGVDPTMTTQAADAAQAAGSAGGIPPGLAFFLGGVSVLLVLTALWYRSQ